MSIKFFECVLHFRHEFEMSIKGKIFYLISAMCLTFAKISSQVMITMPIFVCVLSLEYNTYVTIFFLFVANALPYFLHNVKDHWVNYWMTSETKCGYELMLKFLPNSSSSGIYIRHNLYEKRHNT